MATPGTGDRIVFAAKRVLLVGRRTARNLVSDSVWATARPRIDRITDLELLASDRSELYTVTDARERDLELGKVQNLRVAAAAVNGIVVEPGVVFSFWHALGRPSRAKGYVVGRELREGCLIPTVAGGICQLSNALSRTAMAAAMPVVERHRHSANLDGIAFDPATDATVFWNYIDFRFRAARRVRLSAELTQSQLVVELRGVP